MQFRFYRFDYVVVDILPIRGVDVVDGFHPDSGRGAARFAGRGFLFLEDLDESADEVGDLL